MYRRQMSVWIAVVAMALAACSKDEDFMAKRIENARRLIGSGQTKLDAFRKCLSAVSAALPGVPRGAEVPPPSGLQPPIATALAGMTATYVMEGDLATGGQPETPVVMDSYPWAALDEALKGTEKELKERGDTYYPDSEADIEPLQQSLDEIKYLLVLRGAVLVPKLDFDKTLITSPGSFLGEVLVFSVPEGKHLATVQVAVANSPSLSFTYGSNENRTRAFEKAVAADLRGQLDKAFIEGLNRLAGPAGSAPSGTAQ